MTVSARSATRDEVAPRGPRPPRPEMKRLGVVRTLRGPRLPQSAGFHARWPVDRCEPVPYNHLIPGL